MTATTERNSWNGIRVVARLAGKEQRHASISATQQTLLQASLTHVPTHGWTQDAIVAAVKEHKLPVTMIGLVTPSQLIQTFMNDCNSRLKEQLISSNNSNNHNNNNQDNHFAQDRLAAAIQWRLEMIVPLKRHWHQGMALGAMLPDNLWKTQQQLNDMVQILSDQIHPSWSTMERAAIGAIYVMTELHFLADTSPGHDDTWKFLHRRVNELPSPHAVAAATAVTTSLAGAVVSLVSPSLQAVMGSVMGQWIMPPSTIPVQGATPSDYDTLPPFPTDHVK